MMFARIVSLVQIAAIIACPMWCDSGLCHAGQCCSVKQSAAQVCPVHGTAKCCCNQKSHDNDDNRGPCRCPGKSCQGVCGGAVFEKPIEVNNASDSFLRPLVEAEISFPLQLAECPTLDVQHHWHCHGGNHGRFVRILHMSFLC